MPRKVIEKPHPFRTCSEYSKKHGVPYKEALKSDEYKNYLKEQKAAYTKQQERLARKEKRLKKKEYDARS